jgi:uncharacterized BrkB/YihY/UPF0761 family membrane protein
VLAAVGVEVLHLVTVYWISYAVAKKTERYGAIGAALALLLWAYLLGRVITSAAVLNATVWYRGQPGAVPDLQTEINEINEIRGL